LLLRLLLLLLLPFWLLCMLHCCACLLLWWLSPYVELIQLAWLQEPAKDLQHQHA
jgi:antibiotic biosynthesis monooxygenase (ABM) superfamily enzyme